MVATGEQEGLVGNARLKRSDLSRDHHKHLDNRGGGEHAESQMLCSCVRTIEVTCSTMVNVLVFSSSLAAWGTMRTVPDVNWSVSNAAEACAACGNLAGRLWLVMGRSS